MPPQLGKSLPALAREIARCETCDRLRTYCRGVAQEKRRAYLDDTYWGKPIAGFGDPQAHLLIVGLAPAAHGANRTGRIFTGDRSGQWLYRALHKAGYANQPTYERKDDGLELRDAFVSCVVRCAPPDNKPLPEEITRCSPFLARELELLTNARVFLALGKIALDGLWPFLQKKFALTMKKPKLTHGEALEIAPGHWLLLSYHPSQQNTFTGRLTEPMFDAVFTRAKALITATPEKV